MFYKIGKKTFYFTIHGIHCLQIALILLSFLTVVYWIFQLANAQWINTFAPVFEPIKGFVHTFYTRRVEFMQFDQVTVVDFSFLIASFLMLGLSWGLNFTAEYFEDLEKKFDKTYSDLKRKSEEMFNKELELEHITREYQNNKLILLINFDSVNLLKDNLFEKNTNEGVEEKNKLALKRFEEKLKMKVTFESKNTEKGLMIFFKDVNLVNSLYLEILSAINSVKKEFQESRWKTSFCCAIDVYAREVEIVEKYKKLKSLLKLNMKNEIICLGSFKQRYELLKKQTFNFLSKGSYKISEDEDDVFAITRKEIQ